MTQLPCEPLTGLTGVNFIWPQLTESVRSAETVPLGPETNKRPCGLKSKNQPNLLLPKKSQKPHIHTHTPQVYYFLSCWVFLEFSEPQYILLF